MRCEFNLLDGTLNLDLTSKILRRVGAQQWKTGTTSGRAAYCEITKNSQNFRQTMVLSATTGTIPPRPTPPFLFIPQGGGPIKIGSGNVDGNIYWYTSSVRSVVNGAAFTYTYPLETWADETNVQYQDYIRIRDQDGKLLWSTGTIGDALFRVHQFEIDAVDKVYTYTSTDNRRLHLLLDDTFTGGTETETMTSYSGLQMRWRNNGRTVDVSYGSSWDNDIYNYFAAGNISIVNIFEVYDGV